MCVLTARLKRPAANSDDQLSDSQQQSTPTQKKPRVFFTEHQKAALREAFQRDSYPNQTSLERLASELGVGTKTVVNWFHNHRMRAKQQQVPIIITQTTIARHNKPCPTAQLSASTWHI